MSDQPSNSTKGNLYVSANAMLVRRRSAPPSERACTCHSDDRPPVPCVKGYALSECRRIALQAAEAKLSALSGLADAMLAESRRPAETEYDERWSCTLFVAASRIRALVGDGS